MNVSQKETVRQIKRDGRAGLMRKQLDRVAKERRRQVNKERNER